MTDSKLLHDTKRAIWLARHADQAVWAEAYWDAGQVWADTDAELEAEARAALAVFEKAHTPTDDERVAIALTDSEWRAFQDMPQQSYFSARTWFDGVLASRITSRRSVVPEPSAAPTFPPEILAIAARFTKPDALNRLVVLMMTTWGEKDPESSVAQHPTSYVATFADMAKAILADRSEPQGEPSDAQVERARIIADLREWSRPLGVSPEEETLRLVIERIERDAVTEQGTPCTNCGAPGAVRAVVGNVLCDPCVEKFTEWAGGGENR